MPLQPLLPSGAQESASGLGRNQALINASRARIQGEYQAAEVEALRCYINALSNNYEFATVLELLQIRNGDWPREPLAVDPDFTRGLMEEIDRSSR